MIFLDDKTVFLSDNCLFYHLLSDNQELVKEASTIFNYLSYRRYNKKIVLPPTFYHQLKKLFEKDIESVLYFKNYFENAEYTNNFNDGKKELLVLAKVLRTLNEKVFVISNYLEGDLPFNTELNKMQVSLFNIHEVYSYLLSKKDFRDYIEAKQ